LEFEVRSIYHAKKIVYFINITIISDTGDLWS
jgi:hypothetical protein